MSNLKNVFLEARERGVLFTVTFEKRDGTLRTLTGRGGVTAYITGAGLSFIPEDKGMSTLFEQPRCPHCGKYVKYQKDGGVHNSCGGTLPPGLGGYKMVTWDKIKQVKVGGMVYYA